MQVQLCTMTSENYRVDKNVTVQATVDCVLKDGTSVENPVILLNSANISGCNYMYIPEFHRYYYVNDIVCVRNGLWEVHGHVDVLMSYSSGIKGCTATLKRQENLFNMYLDDPEFKTYNKSEIVTKLFSGGSGTLSKNMHYILVVAGG